MNHLEDRDKCVETLLQKGLFLSPTDSIWGISCDAFSPEAVQALNLLKCRPADKSYIVLVSDIDMLKEYVREVHPKIEAVLAYFTRPLTVIYTPKMLFPPGVCASDNTIGIRITQDPLLKSIIDVFGKPIISTSANVHGEPFPHHFGEISSTILQGVQYICKSRRSEKIHGEPSVVVRLDANEELEFIRS